uniref:Uncharacterized protein n=1 Tax=Globodera rostochiensis TaxID=31243 RepID=A0A914IA59_GLORO
MRKHFLLPLFFIVLTNFVPSGVSSDNPKVPAGESTAANAPEMLPSWKVKLLQRKEEARKRRQEVEARLIEHHKKMIKYLETEPEKRREFLKGELEKERLEQKQKMDTLRKELLEWKKNCTKTNSETVGEGTATSTNSKTVGEGTATSTNSKTVGEGTATSTNSKTVGEGTATSTNSKTVGEGTATSTNSESGNSKAVGEGTATSTNSKTVGEGTATSTNSKTVGEGTATSTNSKTVGEGTATSTNSKTVGEGTATSTNSKTVGEGTATSTNSESGNSKAVGEGTATSTNSESGNSKAVGEGTATSNASYTLARRPAADQPEKSIESEPIMDESKSMVEENKPNNDQSELTITKFDETSESKPTKTDSFNREQMPDFGPTQHDAAGAISAVTGDGDISAEKPSEVAE